MTAISDRLACAHRRPTRSRGAATARLLLRRYPVWLMLFAALLVFGYYGTHFWTLFNLSNILLQAALFGFPAIGLTVLIISRNIDLTVGSVAGLAACIAVSLQPTLGVGLPIVIGLLAGVLVGLLNGFLVERAGIDSFLVTLAGMIGIKGLCFAFAGENTIAATSELFGEVGTYRVGHVHFIALVFLALLGLAHYVLAYTAFGRELYAVGGNRTAAVNAGVRVSRNVILAFVGSGFLAALCGIAMAANLGAATPTFCIGYEGWAITAVVLGGAKLSGGSGRIVNTLGGVLLLATLRNGLNMIHVPGYYALVTIGGSLLLALAFDRQLTRQT